MSVVNVEPGREVDSRRANHLWGAIGVFALIATYTLTTFDDLPLQRFALGTITLAFVAMFLAASFRQHLRFNVPAVCLLVMAVYSAVQTAFFPQKIAFYGWTKTVFWFTAASIALLATQTFQSLKIARQFRYAFAILASSVCLLDVLQQASHTNKYFWIFQSRWTQIYGSFASHNNFAQLVELSLPITLWIGIGHRRPNLLFVSLGALQVGSVAAASSRAGIALVMVEMVAVAAIAYHRYRRPAVVLALGLLLVLSVIFVFVAGFEGVAGKFKGDQLLVRREINKSSLAMIAQRPLTGWGMGTYMYIYPMFARYDDGTYVNQAHNDWLEWAAEGGVIFSGLMLVVFVWSIVPAVRSVWGIGLIALCLNAAVDYPFARLGVCGWYFALVGMLAAHSVQETEQRKHYRGHSHRSA